MNNSENARSHLVVELCQRHFRLYDDDDESKERTDKRVIGDSFSTFRQNVAKSKSVADILTSSWFDQLHGYIAIFLVLTAALCHNHRH